MKAYVVIPARLASTRLPEKPLLKDTGKFLVQHVYEQALKAQKVSKVIIATDAQEIVSAVESFGGEVQLTRADHESGTDRIAEVATREQADIFVNVQGDEPEIHPDSIDQVVSLLIDHPEADVATLAYPIDAGSAQDPNVVKVVCAKNGYALYFSRSAIPYIRDEQADKTSVYLGHVGIYAYRSSFLEVYSSLQQSFLEKLEKLEQLRVLENDYKIIVGQTDDRVCGVDTIDDYQKFVERYNKNA